MRLRVPLCWALSFAMLALTTAVASADTSDSTYAITGTPFGGWWDRFGIAHPSYHHRVECEPQSKTTYDTKPACNTSWGPGDWSVDYYGDNRPVIFGLPSTAGSWSAQVWAIYPTCSGSGGGSIAGWTVFVDVYINNSWEGWESFGHLDRLQVSPGQWLWQSAVLGYTKLWPNTPGCYEADDPTDVHVHHEEWNLNRYACYWNYASGSYLDYNRWFGTVGRTNKTQIRQAC